MYSFAVYHHRLEKEKLFNWMMWQVHSLVMVDLLRPLARSPDTVVDRTRAAVLEMLRSLIIIIMLKLSLSN